MSLWKTVKKDIQKGFKEGATLVKKRAKKLTKEGQDKFKTYDLKYEVQIQMEELGGRIYDLSSKMKNPLLDSKVQTILKRINRLEEKIAKLEGKAPKTSTKKGRKRKTKSKRKTKTTSQK